MDGRWHQQHAIGPFLGCQEESLSTVQENPATGLHGTLGSLQGGDEVKEGDAVVLGQVRQHHPGAQLMEYL